MLINDEGYVQALPDGMSAQCHISIHASTWQKLLRSQAFGVGDVGIEGDADLAMQLLPIFGQLRYEPYVDASRLFGNTIASHLDHQAKRVWDNAQEAFKRVEGEVRDFVQESNAPLVSLQQWQEHSDGIDALRDDVARLQARLEKLSH